MIYLDNAATTQMCPQAIRAFISSVNTFGNPGSPHKTGVDAKRAVEKAREQVAGLLHTSPEHIIFTAGGTESNNLAIKGRGGVVAAWYPDIEHPSVTNASKALNGTEGGFFDGEFSYLSAAEDGFAGIADEIAADPRGRNGSVLSVMLANNEINIENDVKSIAALCGDRGIVFHTDCVQAAGYQDIDVEDIGCDSASISSHKIYGPKGVGALYVRDLSRYRPVIDGGGQERGLRAGTENVQAIIGFGAACEYVSQNLGEIRRGIDSAKSAFIQTLNNMIEEHSLGVECRYNMPPELPGKTISICFPGIDSETMVYALDSNGVVVSAGAACSSHEQKPSRVLKALGLSDEDAMCSIRVSFGKDTTIADATQAAAVIYNTAVILKRMSGTQKQ